MNEQENARQFGGYDFNPADLGDDKISQMSRRMQKVREGWDKTDGVKK